MNEIFCVTATIQSICMNAQKNYILPIEVTTMRKDNDRDADRQWLSRRHYLTAVAGAERAGHWLFFPALALSGLTFSLVLFSQGMDRVFNLRLLLVLNQRTAHCHRCQRQNEIPSLSHSALPRTLLYSTG
jgi:hypothetical protein